MPRFELVKPLEDLEKRLLHEVVRFVGSAGCRRKPPMRPASNTRVVTIEQGVYGCAIAGPRPDHELERRLSRRREARRQVRPTSAVMVPRGFVHQSKGAELDGNGGYHSPPAT